MALVSQPIKRRKVDNTDGVGAGYAEMKELLRQKRWEIVIRLVNENPLVVQDAPDPTPLAMACRAGAPYACIAAIMEAHPPHLRRVLDSRGSPLHEAIVCEQTGAEVIELLLRKDEELGPENRATLLQDVDGFTPLHLLIRRRFQTHILHENTSLLQILEMLVRSCPDSVEVPDRGEYEEPPLVYAIKAKIYAPVLGSEDDNRVERQIFEMVDCMLRYNPQAAGKVLTGFRGQYTALHSAVFHGRCTDTLQLIIQSEAATLTSPDQPKAALLQNTQGEIPLHFCTMRGERPRSVALIANAAPEGVSKRDSSGLTPFHWLWIRLVSTLLTLEGGGRGTNTTISLPTHRTVPPMEISSYNEFVILEQGDFDADQHLIKRMDPSIDFLRMRHIPDEVIAQTDCLRRSRRSADILRMLREHHIEASSTGPDETRDWTREEVVLAFFWSKVVSLLQTVNRTASTPIAGEQTLVHIAFRVKCCPAWVSYMAAQLFPAELLATDSLGRLPLHYAASREWSRWDWPCDAAAMTTDSNATKMLLYDSIHMLRTALEFSPPTAVRVLDHKGRLVLHYLIDNLVSASAHMTKSMHEEPLKDMLGVVHEVVNLYPEALSFRDGESGLLPFQQVAAKATELRDEKEEGLYCEQFPLSLSYELLRENPTLVSRNPG